MRYVFDEVVFDEIRANLGVERGSEGATPDVVAERHGYPTLSKPTASSAADGKRSPTGKAAFGSVTRDIRLSDPYPATFVREVAS